MDIKYQPQYPEVWGGIECTINRVGDHFRDQLELGGHYKRRGDLEKFSSLGIKKLRYPVLWERHQPTEQDKINWNWTDRQLNTIRDLDIVPIAGLLHHGSGPSFTNLADPNFSSRFASYAAKVAARFPWINNFTPINEPLTTARFSGLYGFWYPHVRSERAFVEMLLNQLKATVLAMEAIRGVNREAKLIQTEDLSKIHSSATLSYQADFENERRWLSIDLLCGHVCKGHPLWSHIRKLGISEKKLSFFLDHPLEPDSLGFNYYVTSERYLTERIHQFPGYEPGGNNKHTYVDVEAVRSGHHIGVKQLLVEAWDRYRLPMAITECHINCTPDEQIRWFCEVWQSAKDLKNEGIDVIAVTAWALMGAFDWNSLLTREDFYYESGVFDISRGYTRETELCDMLRQLSKTGDYPHTALNRLGWWHDCEKNSQPEKYNAGLPV